MEFLPILSTDLVWQIVLGSSIRIGIDNFVGGDDCFKLSRALIDDLRSKGYSTFDHVCVLASSHHAYWLSADYMTLFGTLRKEWIDNKFSLSRLGIRLSTHSDVPCWKCNILDGVVTTRCAFDCLFVLHSGLLTPWWATKFWKWHLPYKLKCFYWLLLNNIVLTWDNLFKRGWVGPSVCPLCMEELEIV